MPTYKAIKVILRHRPERDGESPFPDIKPAYDANPADFDDLLPHDYISKYGVGWQYNKVNNLGKGDDTGEAVCLIPATGADAERSGH